MSHFELDPKPFKSRMFNRQSEHYLLRLYLLSMMAYKIGNRPKSDRLYQKYVKMDRMEREHLRSTIESWQRAQQIDHVPKGCLLGFLL